MPLFLLIAAACFALRGFGIVHDYEHFNWLLIGLLSFVLSFLVPALDTYRGRSRV